MILLSLSMYFVKYLKSFILLHLHIYKISSRIIYFLNDISGFYYEKIEINLIYYDIDELILNYFVIKYIK